MTDGENTQQTQRGNCQVAESEQHCIHLLEAEAELLAECHRYRVYLAVCGQVLPVSKLPSSDCGIECERECECEMITYCQDCLHHAARCNAEAGVGVGRSPYVRTDR